MKMRQLVAAAVCVGILLASSRAALAEGHVPDGEAVVVVETLFLQIGRDAAAEWGLDGGPPTKEVGLPQKKELPRLLTAQEAKQAIGSLRERKDTVIVGSARCATRSGNTAIYRNVKAFTIEGEEPRDCGLTLEVTPTLDAARASVALDLRPQLVRFSGWIGEDDARTPVFSTISIETAVDMPLGATLIVAGGVPALDTVNPLAQNPATDALPGLDDRCLLICVTATVAEAVPARQPAP
jgi:hypothetical protein